ncbi:CheR family methyltransferase [Pantanalinema rosaneae CENA516]|uniref:CheR family methyltransferase n=1 Tax=Pantanalinema rosaneae TaxID=1620701 RepID=UPI003D6E1A30
MSAQMRSEKNPLHDGVPDTSEVNPEFETLLDYLKHFQGCDLTGYKRSSLMRRFQHRMQIINIDTYQGYLQHLQSHSQEYLALLNEVLINFTSFFRDREIWSYLAAEIIPQIIANKQPDEPIRIWSAGCAAGQEIYSLLILFAEALGLEACSQHVRCFATDADALALAQARQATYSELEVADITPDLLKKYFVQTEEGYSFHPILRRTVIFSQHDLIRNAPISRLDLLMCRNVLIYFNSNTQTAILSRFHFALKPKGFLCLGKAETLVKRRQIFTPISSRHHVYTKGLELDLDDYLSATSKSDQQPTSLFSIQSYFWKAAVETSASAYLAIDTNGYLLHVNDQARILFHLTLDDWICPFQELELAKLMSPSTFVQALGSRQNVFVLKNVEWTAATEIKYFDVIISQVFDCKRCLLGLTLTFVEIKQCNQLKSELETTRLELIRVSETLEKTKSELSLAYRDLESVQKELDVLHQDMYFTGQQIPPHDRDE